MKRMIAAGVLGLLIGLPFAIQGHDKPKKPPKGAMEVAGGCVSGAMAGGTTKTAEELADFCIEVARRVVQADYALVP